MELSLFLGKVMGFYLAIVGIAYLVRKDYFVAVVDDYLKSPGLILFGAIINLILGLLVVLSHNIWVLGWPVIITIIGYLMLFKGLLWLFFPEYGKKLANKMSGHVYLVSGVISLVLGGYLLYMIY